MNFPVPDAFRHGEAFQEHLYQPETRAGDVVFFSEATVHGALPWKAQHERRTILYRFSPAGNSYGRSWLPEWFDTSDCTEAEQSVLLPPYHTRLDRPLLDVQDGEVVVVKNERAKEKIAFDRKIFGKDYF